MVCAAECRLNDKKEQLLEKELVLDEVTSLSDKLRLQASEQRELTLELAKKVNDYQARIRAINRTAPPTHSLRASPLSALLLYSLLRAVSLSLSLFTTPEKMMAAVSELSMYQAQAMKLESTKAAQTQLLAQAKDRLAAGQPPTEDAEHEWYRKERDRMVQKEAVLQRARMQRLVATGGQAGLTEDGAPAPAALARPRNTKAEDRPNAYIPEDLGNPPFSLTLFCSH